MTTFKATGARPCASTFLISKQLLRIKNQVFVEMQKYQCCVLVLAFHLPFGQSSLNFL